MEYIKKLLQFSIKKVSSPSDVSEAAMLVICIRKALSSNLLRMTTGGVESYNMYLCNVYVYVGVS
jgi:hypothetical protein